MLNVDFDIHNKSTLFLWLFIVHDHIMNLPGVSDRKSLTRLIYIIRQTISGITKLILLSWWVYCLFEKIVLAAFTESCIILTFIPKLLFASISGRPAVSGWKYTISHNKEMYLDNIHDFYLVIILWRKKYIQIKKEK